MVIMRIHVKFLAQKTSKQSLTAFLINKYVVRPEAHVLNATLKYLSVVVSVRNMLTTETYFLKNKKNVAFSWATAFLELEEVQC